MVRPSAVRPGGSSEESGHRIVRRDADPLPASLGEEPEGVVHCANWTEFPPRIHSIERLADLTDMRALLEQTLLDLEDFYIRLRYPDFSGPLRYELAEATDAEQALRLTNSALSAIEEEIFAVTQADSEDGDAENDRDVQ